MRVFGGSEIAVVQDYLASVMVGTMAAYLLILPKMD